jgi:hypothetical protein
VQYLSNLHAFLFLLDLICCRGVGARAADELSIRRSGANNGYWKIRSPAWQFPIAGFPSTLLKHGHFPVITDELILAVKKENPVYNAHRTPKGDF